MKNNDKNKPFTISASEDFYDIRINPVQTYYKVNVDKIKTIKDIKMILNHLNLTFGPKSKEEFEEMKHLLILN